MNMELIVSYISCREWFLREFIYVFIALNTEYVTEEAQDTPMDMNTSTDRNATTLFFSELMRGKHLNLYFFCAVTREKENLRLNVDGFYKQQ